MSGQDWSITINESDSGETTFDPEALETENADIVSWNNSTGQAHHPVPANPDGTPDTSPGAIELSTEIPAWQSSTPGYVTQAPATGTTTIEYVCLLHPEERGSIVVSAD